MKLDLSQIQLINSLDLIARVSARDCFEQNGSIVFLVPESQMRQAIGKNGAMVERIKKKLGKNIELFEYTAEPENFFRKAFYKAKLDKVEIVSKGKGDEIEKIALISADSGNKKIVLANIGRLKKIKELAKRNYEISEVRIK